MGSEEITFASRDVRLGGTIAVPDAPGPHPGLVLVGGSGPSDRHNDGFFDVLRERLLTHGLATLSYDKRGVGASTGTWQTATVDELASDAGAALQTLREQPRIRPAAVGVLGHSEGGWVALRLGARGQAPAHLILHSCPGVSFIDSEVFALTAAGVPADSASRAGVLLRELAAAASSGQELDHGIRLMTAARHEPWHQLVAESGFVLDSASWEQLRAWGAYDPIDDLSVLALPTLIVLGGDDPLTPLEASVSRFEATAEAVGRRQEIAVFGGANHRLQLPATGELAQGYVERLSAWSLQAGDAADS